MIRSIQRAFVVLTIVLVGGLRADSSSSRPAAESAALQPASSPFEPMGVLSGRITDDQGKPVTDANVTLTGPSRQRTTTDEDGVYAFDGIRGDGDYRIEIKSDQCAGYTSYNEMPVVFLRAEGQVVKHFRLPRAGRIKAKVVDGAGQPLAGAELLVSKAGRHFGGSIGNMDSPKTDRDGSASIGGLTPKVGYLIIAMYDEMAPAGTTVFVDESGKTVETTLALVPGTTVKGRAICSDGKPAAGWKIQPTPIWWTDLRCPSAFDIDDEGNFELENIGPGDYNIQIMIPEGTRSFSGLNVMSTNLPPAGGSLEVRVPRPSPGSVVSISGTIHYTGERPKQGISVTAMSEKNEHHWAQVNADQDSFAIEQLTPGLYELRFESSGLKEKIIKNVKAPTENLEVELEVVGKPILSGMVVDAVTGKPVEQFRVRARKLRTLSGPNYVPDSQWRSQSAEDGAFSTEVVGPGVYQVQISAEGYAWALSREINTDQDPRDGIKIELKKGITLSGQVVDESGKPISGAKVIPLSKAAGIMDRALSMFVTQEGAVETVDGRFSLDNLSPGKETLKATHPDYCFTVTDEFKLAEGATPQDIRIILTTGGTVCGHVYDSEGQPAAGVQLAFQDREGYGGFGDEEAGRLATTITDASGAYEVKHLPPQAVFINRSDRWTGQGVVRQTVLPKQNDTRIVDFGGSSPVKGRILVNGRPLANTRLQLGGDNPHFGAFQMYGMTDANGAFTFRGPTPGRWRLYHMLESRRQEWAKVADVEVTGTDLDLGTIDRKTGKVQVRLEVKDASQLEGVRVSLREYKPGQNWGNQVGVLKSRQNVNEPFVFEQVPPGEYDVQAYRPDYSVSRKRATLKPGEEAVMVSVPLYAGTGKVELVVSDKDAIQSLQMIRLCSRKGDLDTALSLNDSGNRLAENLPAGEYAIMNWHGRDATPIHEFKLAEGERKVIDLARLASTAPADAPLPIGLLRVGVFSEAGLALPGAQAWLEGPAGRIEPSLVSDRTVFFNGPPGDYTLHVSRPGYEPVSRPARLQVVDPTRGQAKEVDLTVELKRAKRSGS